MKMSICQRMGVARIFPGGQNFEKKIKQCGLQSERPSHVGGAGEKISSKSVHLEPCCKLNFIILLLKITRFLRFNYFYHTSWYKKTVPLNKHVNNKSQ